MNRLDRFFEILARGSTVAARCERRRRRRKQLEFAQVTATTSLAAGVMTIVFGVVARLPFAFAAGLGINAFVPMQLKLAITAGIGLFILFIGLVDAGFIGSTGVASPPVGLGTGGIGSINSVPTVVFVLTLLVTGILVARRVRGGILIGVVSGTVVAVVIEAIWHLGSAVERPGGWSLSVPTLSGFSFALPDLSLVGAFTLDSFGRIGVVAATMFVFTLVFANFFDAMGTFTGLSREAGLADEQGTFLRLPSVLIV